MKIYLVYAVRSCSGRYVTFELVTSRQQVAADRYYFLKAGGGRREEQENYPQFDWAELELEESPSAAAQLTLATLCDIVLGEDAADRSDEALIRAVRALRGWE